MNARRVAAACVAAVMVVFLAACGARVDTVLDVAADGSGVRTMTLTLSTSDRDEYVTGGNAALDASVRKHLPSELTYSGLTETPGQDGAAGQVTAVFALEFGSLKEYRTKVAALLAANGSTQVPTIDLRIEDSLFLQGVVVQEDFTSEDLLAWLEAGLIADGVVSSDAGGNVTEDGDTSVRAADRTYETYQPVHVEEVRDVGMESVVMRTTVSEDGQVTRSIDYAMAADAYATNPDAFDDFLADATPTGGTLDAGPEVDGTHTWTMTFTVPAEDLGSATSQALGGADATFALTKRFDPTPPALSLAVNETADCTRICSPDAPEVRDTLVLPAAWQPTEGSGVEATDAGSGQAAYDVRLPVEELTFSQALPVSSARVTTEVYPDLTVAQTVVLTVPASADEVAGADFEAMLRGGGDGTSLAVERGDDSSVYTLEFARASAGSVRAAADRAGIQGLEVSAGRSEGDGFFRSRVGVAVYDPFGEWGIGDVKSVVRGAGGLSLDDGDGQGSGVVVAVLSGWTTAGLVTLGALAFLVLALVVAAFLLRTRIARAWQRVRAGARERAVAAGAAAQSARERAAAQPASTGTMSGQRGQVASGPSANGPSANGPSANGPSANDSSVGTAWSEADLI